MSKFIIYDFEVYKYDVLMGTLIINEDGTKELRQIWDEDEIRQFYEFHKKDIWVGHNNYFYDDVILESIVNHKSAYETNCKIVKQGIKMKCHMELYSYDIMSASRSPFSLKLTELICGKNIHTTDVDFNIDRPLTDEEKRLTEEYNADDLCQTDYNFSKFFDQFKLRIDIINQFNLDLRRSLRLTGTQLAANVLGAKNDPLLLYKPIKPIMYSTLELKNERLWEFYLNEEFRQGKSDIINVAGAELTIAAGGLHSAIKKCHFDKILYCDVSGYYNLIMLNYGLLSRAMSSKGKELYEFMYHEQLRLKGDYTKWALRAMYKTILLSVFGAMNNEYSDFYDPWHALLVTITGQLFIVDLLEKLDGLATIVQTNTDGIMLSPNNWDDEQKIIGIIEQWEKRTGFVIKKEHLYNLWQRDVNCYVCETEDGKIDYKGDVLRNYIIDDQQYAGCRLFDCKEPPIIAQGIVDFLIKGIMPEDNVESKKENLTLFQFTCKKGTYDYVTEDLFKCYKNEKGKQIEELVESKITKNLNRAFAEKIEVKDGVFYQTNIVKHKKNKKGVMTQSKIANLPDNVFIYNYDITSKETYEKLKDRIDYNYYVNRIYEKLADFLPEE